MSRGDQGGCCCIAMYTGTPTFASKTEHIMSRYRPIAPKPLAPKPPEGGTSTTDPSDPQTSSSLSLDKGSSKGGGGGGSRRSRKRPQQQTDSSTSASTINAKKSSIIPSENKGRSSGAAAAGSRSSCKTTTTTTTTPGGTTPRSKRREPSPSPHSHNNVVCKEVAVGLTPILSESVAPVFGPGGLQRFNESSDRSSRQSSLFATRSLVNNNNNESSKSYGVAARDNSSVKLGFPGGSSSSWNAVAAPSLLLQQEMMMPLRETEDAAFMERAAAANSPVFLGEVNGSGMSNQRFVGFSGLSFAGEILKGSLPAAVTGPAQGTTMPAEPGMMQQQENHQSSLPSRDTGGRSTVVIKSNESSFRGGGGAFMPLPYASASYGAESEVCSGEDVAESRRTMTNLVTLSLLPDAPIHPEGPSSPSDSSFPSPSSHAKSKSCFPSSHRYGGSSVDWNVEGERNHHQPAAAVADTNLTMFSRGEWLVDQEEECRDSTTGGGNKELTNLRRISDSMFLTDNCFRPVAARDFVEQVSSGRRTQTPSPPPHAIIQHLPVAGAVAGSDRQQQALNEPVVDSYYLDHVYATSSDAVMLTDEQNRILWSNSAFQRAATEKTSGKMQSAGPHIDPLGIPTQLAVLMFQPPYHAAKCKAVLWGFLKKFIFQEVGPCFAESRQLGEWKLSQVQSHEHSYDSRTVSFDVSTVPKDDVVYEGDLSLGLSPHKVIAPQPIKAVESMICLECITKVNPLTAPMMGTVEAFQDQLEKLPLPTIITDFRHKVQWVNTAYKHMVGRPGCSWLSSMVGGSKESEAYSENQIARNVSFICAGEQPPVDVAEFSCQVRIQWTKSGGEKSSLVFPTDVIRLDDNSRGSLFVWKFDIFNGHLPLRI